MPERQWLFDQFKAEVESTMDKKYEVSKGWDDSIRVRESVDWERTSEKGMGMAIIAAPFLIIGLVFLPFYCTYRLNKDQGSKFWNYLRIVIGSNVFALFFHSYYLLHGLPSGILWIVLSILLILTGSYGKSLRDRRA